MSEWALITGASAGIGLELARVFAEHGHHLILVARNEPRLQRLAEELKSRHAVEARVLAKDLARPGAAAEIFAMLRDLPVSMLVNNAGFGQHGPFLNTDLRIHSEMMQLNMNALVELTHWFARPMVARGRGRVLNVGSIAAFQPGPTMNVYYATKAFVYSFSYALAEELEGTGVTVTNLCPGTTRTEFFERAGIHMQRPWPMTEARAVAELGYRAMMKGKRVAIPGLVNRIIAAVSPCLPSRWTAAAVRRVHRQ